MADTKAGPSWSDLRAEALALADAAAGRNLVLRLVGSVGVRLSSMEAERLMNGLRPPPKDLDYICRARDRNPLKALFVERGYMVDRDMMIAMEGQRYAFHQPATGLKVDLFVDRLEFCHTVDLPGWLDRPGLTISREGLLLHKLQIVSLTAGDFLDLGVLLYLHDIGAGPDGFDLAKLIAPLSADWGFCHTVERNLAKLGQHAAAGGFAGLGTDAGARIAARAEVLAHALGTAPKTMRWKLRAQLGERMQWWQDVDDREGTY